MASISGIAGLRAAPSAAETLSTPPYDVIKEGSALEARLSANADSYFHVILGQDPAKALASLRQKGLLIDDAEPCLYVYEQIWQGGSRLGMFAAVDVSPYADKQVIRHEKTFDEKVKGRIEAMRKTGFTLEPIFLLTQSPIQGLLEKVRDTASPIYTLNSDFGGLNDLHGIRSRLWRVPERSPEGLALKQAVAQNPLYIADGHHRYHAALLGGHDKAMAYIVEKARILAYNRVINGTVSFQSIKDKLQLEPMAAFATPPKHAFALYSREGAFLLRARHVPKDVVGRLDCSVLEQELYPALGVNHDMVLQKKHFDYYPEHDLPAMKALVDQGEYNLAVALHPVSVEELMDVANAGLGNSEIVMPEKSTFFAPKILSGLLLLKHQVKA